MKFPTNWSNPYAFVMAFAVCLAVVGITMIVFRLGGVGPTEISLLGLDVHTVSAGVVLLVIGIVTMLLAAGQMYSRGSRAMTPNLKPVLLGRASTQNDERHKSIEISLRLNDEHTVRFDATSDRPGTLTVVLNVDGHQQVKRDISPDPRLGMQQINESFPLDGAQWEMTCALGQDGQVSPSLTINGYPIFGVASADGPTTPTPSRAAQ